MREIKFRAWNKKEKRMTPWAYLTTKSLFQLTSFDQLELMQYTGLKDKNGKEIYEGDIIRDFYGAILRIDWAWTKARYMTSYDGEWCQYYLNDFHHNKTDQQSETMEIIGNIYENPELLNQEAPNELGGTD